VSSPNLQVLIAYELMLNVVGLNWSFSSFT
jgi:hypothetical protein